ncbi:unnamed protein product, partial [Rotaria sp. Silwood2]|jgi:quercetin dioxygenase-like cupin family protein
MATG